MISCDLLIDHISEEISCDLQIWPLYIWEIQVQYCSKLQLNLYHILGMKSEIKKANETQIMKDKYGRNIAWKFRKKKDQVKVILQITEMKLRQEKTEQQYRK